MKITIDLSDEDMRKLIANKISAECSKHGHPSSIEPRILIRISGESDPLLLGELMMAVHAEFEVS